MVRTRDGNKKGGNITVGNNTTVAPCSDEAQTKEIILQYLKEQCKPFAINDIVMNLHGKVKKPTMLKTLDKLAKEDKIVCKNFGKVSIYSCKDIEQPHDQNVKEEISLEQLTQLKEEHMEYERDYKQLNDSIYEQQKQPTNEDLKISVKELTIQQSKLERELESLNNISLATDATKDVIQDILNHENILSTEYRKRNKILKSLLNIIEDTHGKKNMNTILENIGYEPLP